MLCSSIICYNQFNLTVNTPKSIDIFVVSFFRNFNSFAPNAEFPYPLFRMFNSLAPNAEFPYPLKTSENLMAFRCEVQKCNIEMKWLKFIQHNIQRINIGAAQPAFTSSKLTKEALGQYVKYVHQNDVIGIVLMSLLLTLKIFYILYQCFYC